MAKNLNWKIMVKHPMWIGWKGLVHMYGLTKEQAQKEAVAAKIYYEGATATKVLPAK
jgi:hypothetical protein